MTTVAIEGLGVERAGVPVLEDVHLTIAPGEVIAILGASGSGKSTLLRAVNYLTPFQSGSVTVGDTRLVPGLCERRDAGLLQAVRRRVGMVFQGFELFPHLRVVDNVMEAPRRVLRLARDEARARAIRLLDRVGLADRVDAFPHALSGGQRQRVAIARALAMEPACLLFDEPTSALDPRLTDEVLSVIATLAAGGQTMVVVTHEIGFARRVASRIVVLDGGRIVETGTPHNVLDAPRTAAARALVGRGVEV